MSGGYFDYTQYRINDAADSIRRVISAGDIDDPEILKRFKLAAETCDRAAKMMQRVDWLLSCDDGPESFLRRWAEDGLDTQA